MLKKEVPKCNKPVLAKIKAFKDTATNIAKAFGHSDEWFEVVYYDGSNWRPWDGNSETFEKEDQVIDWVYVEGCFPRIVAEEKVEE